MNTDPLGRRSSGVLLHATSLPGPHGAGDAGPEAHRFAEWLAAAGLSWWQMLPVAPAGNGNSPYSAQSAFAGDPLLVSPERLAEEGLLTAAELAAAGELPEGRVDHPSTRRHRDALLRQAHRRHSSKPPKEDYLEFCAGAASWLEDWALYAALRLQQGGAAWLDWPAELRDRRASALGAARRDLAVELDYQRFVQWQFARHWRALRDRCAALGISLLGDLPIFVALESADVWAHRELFFLDQDGRPEVVAGVPPDYFSPTGQRWGNPHYRWELHRKRGYGWWIARLSQMLLRFDAIRLDHFIGFARAWHVPANEDTAVNGQWKPGPGAHFFERVKAALGGLPLLAEDLGEVTPEVHALRDRFGLPGMRVLQFAFGGDAQASSFRPHAFRPRCVAYTGTHDNDTALGWYQDPGARSPDKNAAERERALRYLRSHDPSGANIHWDMIETLYASVADTVIIPMQDYLGLGSEARTNRPGVASGNWEWRMQPGAADGALAARLRSLSETFDRAAPESSSHKPTALGQPVEAHS